VDESASTSNGSQTRQLGNSKVQVELRDSSESAIFAVTGLTDLDALRKIPAEELQKYLTVRVQRPGVAINPTPLLGSVEVTKTELCFTSRFPLSESLQYQVVLAPPLRTGPVDDKPILFSKLTKKRNPAAKVSAVYPSSDVLPENLLKFYIHFSAPMSRGEAYKRVHLMYGDTEVDSPFLELGEELWDSDQMRFTLFLHPGRIKRGLKPREDIGAPMVEGNAYRLQIDANWLGADLQPIGTPFVKKFRVVGADSQQPDMRHWKLTTPKVNSKQPASITFDEPLDEALLKRVISVRDTNRTSVDGHVALARDETVWSFVPTEPWKKGTYTFQFASTLEDLAGNSLARRFETAEQESLDPEPVPPHFFIEWVIP
jgi:hypothetical protein